MIISSTVHAKAVESIRSKNPPCPSDPPTTASSFLKNGFLISISLESLTPNLRLSRLSYRSPINANGPQNKKIQSVLKALRESISMVTISSEALMPRIVPSQVLFFDT